MNDFVSNSNWKFFELVLLLMLLYDQPTLEAIMAATYF